MSKRSSVPSHLSLCLIVVSGFFLGSVVDTRAADVGRSQPAAESLDADGPVLDGSGPIPVQYFYARNVPAGVELEWFAVSESDIAGFNIYRREGGASYYFVVNGSGLIPRWRHSFLDGELSPSSYQYVLSVVFTDGSEYISAPVEISTASKSYPSN